MYEKTIFGYEPETEYLLDRRLEWVAMTFSIWKKVPQEEKSKQIRVQDIQFRAEIILPANRKPFAAYNDKHLSNK